MLLIKFLLYFQRKRCILCDNALRRVHIEFSMIYFKDNQNGISANVCGLRYMIRYQPVGWGRFCVVDTIAFLYIFEESDAFCE